MTVTRERLPRSFFERNTIQVAKDLLGMVLVRMEREARIAGVITETEAYRGEEDLACHARAGLTPRTRVMYGPPGHAYVYFTYGMHWLLNFVTEKDGFPAAVLIRSVEIVEGADIVAARRKGRPQQEWTNGPAKLCQALDIDHRLNNLDTCHPDAALFIERGQKIPEKQITSSPRVGLYSVPEPWKSMPWRFLCALR